MKRQLFFGALERDRTLAEGGGGGGRAPLASAPRKAAATEAAATEAAAAAALSSAQQGSRSPASPISTAASPCGLCSVHNALLHYFFLCGRSIKTFSFLLVRESY